MVQSAAPHLDAAQFVLQTGRLVPGHRHLLGVLVQAEIVTLAATQGTGLALFELVPLRGHGEDPLQVAQLGLRDFGRLGQSHPQRTCRLGLAEQFGERRPRLGGSGQGRGSLLCGSVTSGTPLLEPNSQGAPPLLVALQPLPPLVESPSLPHE